MKPQHVIVPVAVIVAGGLVWLNFAEQISPEDYHTEPIEALLHTGLYGGSEAIAELPVWKPFLYINQPDTDGGYFLYVLIPVPEGTSVGSPTFDTPTEGTLRVKYNVECSDPRGAVSGLFHQTLIPVDARVGTVIVVCATAAGEVGTSTVGTSDADHEDPISGGPATPYMSGMTTDGLMLYTGGGECGVIVDRIGGSVTRTTVNGEPVFKRFDPGDADFTRFTVGGREVKGVL